VIVSDPTANTATSFVETTLEAVRVAHAIMFPVAESVSRAKWLTVPHAAEAVVYVTVAVL
jgi:hypothetical protein